ncbi:MAG: DUF1826 domain-containing protein [Pedobacter sp.]|nr:MAG: DUF1826 domain-containing protein [Pedobacter sp.]
MKSSFHDNNQVGIVSTFDELVNTSFQGRVNAICWERDLAGDFKEIVAKLQLKENVTDISMEELLALPLSEEGNIAREIIIKDFNSLSDFGALPTLNLLKSYERDEEFDFISTDVYSYHVDRSPIAADTFLCTYYGAASDIIPNHQVEKKVLIPEIRKKLSELYDGAETGFEDFLKEYSFDLHYQPKPDADHFNLGVGHLWKLAVAHPGQQVLPCVHRAPQENEGQFRLLLIC